MHIRSIEWARPIPVVVPGMFAADLRAAREAKDVRRLLRLGYDWSIDFTNV